MKAAGAFRDAPAAFSSIHARPAADYRLMQVAGQVFKQTDLAASSTNGGAPSRLT